MHDGVSKATQSVQLLGIVEVGDDTKRALVSQLIQTLCLTGDCKTRKRSLIIGSRRMPTSPQPMIKRRGLPNLFKAFMPEIV